MNRYLPNRHWLLLCLLLTSYTLRAQPGASVQTTVGHFLSTLSPDEQTKATYAFSDTTRRKWTNLPVGMVPRPGIAYGALTDQSRMAFHRVLSSLLSSQGYLKVVSIMALDDILNTLYQQAFDAGKIDQRTLTMMQNLKWAHGNFYISIWGKPQEKAPWGLNFGGHHMALSITVNGGDVITSPMFYGTDPSEVKSAKYAGLRVLSKEEDYGFMLVNALTDKQRAKAVLPQAVPKDIITSPQANQRITSYYGLSAGDFSDDQRVILTMLLQEYMHNFEHQTAHRLYDKLLKTGFDKVYFAWVGSLENNKPHYYIINTPDFLIEYDNVGFQNDGNHIHAILREKGNDFGDDLLKRHYAEAKH
ncbi:DUF3500 domain-containing protein [Fibrella aquatilis]|uniref:DUF3500 domain-containing protein n=1 Tax=Fibrella aquatilis TaxID=2817059 RepID=UPI00286E32BC|nr:DUF3500 domain-containing protein [Fibrella aquatilis]